MSRIGDVVGLISGSGDHAKVAQHWRIRTESEITADELALTIEGLIGEVLTEVDRREGDRYEDAAEIFREVALGQEFPAFLTLPKGVAAKGLPTIVVSSAG